MPAACEWPGGCANDPHHQVPDGVPVYRLLKIDSDEVDGDYCRVVTHDGTFYQCGRGDCQDDTHRVRAALL